MDLEITDFVTDADRDKISAGLQEYNLTQSEYINPVDIGIYHKEDGEITAGLFGKTQGNWMEIDCLWVSENLRNQGVGSQLLVAAEQEAIRRNCKYCLLNTYGFQAPYFYIKHGYREVFVLEHLPINGTCHYYVKNLI